jgi:formate/nitrite transporter FocA (FNT family)
VTDRAQEAGPDQLTETFERTVDEGLFRLERTTPGLLATGTVGGADVSLGVFALLLVLADTGSDLLAALAFSVGFVALTLAGSELFTENFLVPIAAVAARKAEVPQVMRLWAGTATTNLVGGWLVIGLVTTGFPRLRDASVTVARHYPEIGVGWRSFAGALLGGAVITLMTWMERSTESVTGKLAAAVSAAFILAAGPLNHAIVASLEMFAALQYGAPFGYADWARVTAWYAVGNCVGGIGMVSGLRLVQLGRERLETEQHKPVRSTGSGE